MLAIVITMLLILAISLVVVTYAAYPHRGEDVPYAPRVGAAMRKGVDALPTLEDSERR